MKLLRSKSFLFLVAFFLLSLIFLTNAKGTLAQCSVYTQYSVAVSTLPYTFTNRGCLGNNTIYTLPYTNEYSTVYNTIPTGIVYQNGQDCSVCGGDYWDTGNCICAGTMKQCMWHDRGCQGGSCVDVASYQNYTACATAGPCQTGGGCSGGVCQAIYNTYTSGQHGCAAGNHCTTTYTCIPNCWGTGSDGTCNSACIYPNIIGTYCYYTGTTCSTARVCTSCVYCASVWNANCTTAGECSGTGSGACYTGTGGAWVRSAKPWSGSICVNSCSSFANAWVADNAGQCTWKQ